MLTVRPILGRMFRVRGLLRVLVLGQVGVVSVAVAGVATASPSTTWVVERAMGNDGSVVDVAGASVCGELPGVTEFLDLYRDPGIIYIKVQQSAQAKTVRDCLDRLKGFSGPAVVTVHRGHLSAFNGD